MSLSGLYDLYSLLWLQVRRLGGVESKFFAIINNNGSLIITFLHFFVRAIILDSNPILHDNSEIQKLSTKIMGFNFKEII